MELSVAVDLAVFGVALAGLLVAEARVSRRGVWWTKPVASAAFLALPFLLGVRDVALVVGLALSFLGDFFLIPADPRAFRVGLFAFLAAHIAYAFAFLRLGSAPVWLALAAIALLAAGVGIGRWVLPHVDASMRIPVLAYMLVISIMVLAAAGATGAGAPAWLLGAALLFYASDITVARHRFVLAAPVNRLVGLPMYYAAQLAFAFAAATLAG